MQKNEKLTDRDRDRMILGEEQEITIEDFFALCKDGGTYQIDTPDGWQDIQSLVQKNNKQCYNLVFDDGTELGCSEDHLVLTDDFGWVFAKDLNVNNHRVLTRDGCVGIAAKEFMGERITFDLEVGSEEHRYYSNNIISHNTGKSMVSDALASLYEMPLMRLDIGALFSAHIGESEENTRNAIQTVEAISPCILGSTTIIINGLKTSIDDLFCEEESKYTNEKTINTDGSQEVVYINKNTLDIR